MDIGLLRSFLTLAREGHMTRAAAELHLTQPAVSAQLARLEDELGHRLFDRTPRGMVLTEAGRLFRDHATQVLAQLQAGRDALDELAGLERGELAIGGGATATTYLLPPLLGRFHQRYPGVRLFVREQGSQGVVEALGDGELDLGVVTLPLASAATRSKLEVVDWLEDELRLIVPPEHPLAAERAFRWAALDAMPFVLFEAGSAVRGLIDHHLAAAGVQVQIVMELRSIESIKQMVAQGIGAAFVSRFALPTADHGLRCDQDPITRPLAIVHRKDRALRRAARVFLDLMRDL